MSERDAEVPGRLPKARLSCRAFPDRDVDPSLIDRVLADAPQVASLCNSRPWQMIAGSRDATECLTGTLHVHVADAAPKVVAWRSTRAALRKTCARSAPR